MSFLVSNHFNLLVLLVKLTRRPRSDLLAIRRNDEKHSLRHEPCHLHNLNETPETLVDVFFAAVIC